MRRLAAFGGVFGVLVVTNGLAGALVLADGLAGMATPTALAAAVGLTAASWVAVGWIVRRAGPAEAGLRPTSRTLPGAAAGLLAGAGAAGVVVGAAVATGAGTLRPGHPTAAPALVAAALVVNAVFQDLGLLGLGSALGGRVGWGVALALFTALHLAESTAPLYVANVAAFGGLLVAAFHARRDPGLPLGLHAGVNAALVLLGALPGTEDVAVAALHTASPAWGAGGGVESGLAWTGVLAAGWGVVFAGGRGRGR